jgi:phage antirepressor YoqD-like protein
MRLCHLSAAKRSPASEATDPGRDFQQVRQIMHHHLIIANTLIRQDDKGRFCLNDLHRAAGAESKYQPSNFMRLDGTKALMAEINQSSEVMSVYINVGGASPGTFAARELVYAYAMWINASFHLQVIRAYDSMSVSTSPAIPQTLSAALRLAADQADQIEAQQVQLAIAEPKALALDRIADADGAMCITDAAKHLQMAPKKLFSWLSANDWIYRRPGAAHWVAYQPRLKSGVLDHKITLVTRGDGSEKVTEQVLVTAKGLARLAGVAA